MAVQSLSHTGSQPLIQGWGLGYLGAGGVLSQLTHLRRFMRSRRAGSPGPGGKCLLSPEGTLSSSWGNLPVCIRDTKGASKGALSDSEMSPLQDRERSAGWPEASCPPQSLHSDGPACLRAGGAGRSPSADQPGRLPVDATPAPCPGQGARRTESFSDVPELPELGRAGHAGSGAGRSDPRACVLVSTGHLLPLRHSGAV